MTSRRDYDYIIVGGGSSGCVLAAELCERTSAKVLLLEAGPSAEEHPETLSADGYKHAFVNDAVMGERFSVPQKEAGKQRVYLGTGTVLGGSGSVNGMVYTRGAREDYDAWPEGWRWSDNLAGFEALERKLRVHQRQPTAWTEACIAAAEQCGFTRKDDLNDGDLSNVIGYEWMSYEGDARRSSYVSFLRGRVGNTGAATFGSPLSREARSEGKRLPGLDVRTSATVHKLLVSSNRRVTGVQFESVGHLMQAHARHEVILCAGALETPKLLMLSGMGPAEHLRSHGIDVVLDQPAVGQGLHDHPNVPVFFKTKPVVDCRYPQLYSFYRTLPDADLPPGQSDTCYVFWPAPSSMKHMMQRMLPPKVVPHVLYGPRSRQIVRSLVSATFRVPGVARFTDHLFGIIVILGKPKSRGSLHLASTSPYAQARIDPAYYSDPQDLETMVQGVRHARKIGTTDAFADWHTKELMPGRGNTKDKSIARYVRNNTITTYHFAGTCQMGERASSVVDTELRVRGVTGLRIADASVIPYTPVSALNAPSMLIGYRAAEKLAKQFETRPKTGDKVAI